MLDKITGAIKGGYIRALYFTDCGDIDQPAVDIELSSDALSRIDSDIARFIELIQFADLPDSVTYDQLGIDFWLTRNGHGTGFWDRHDVYGEQLAKLLTNISKSFGEVWPYESDNNELEVY